jgi:hypothetical protein
MKKHILLGLILASFYTQAQILPPPPPSENPTPPINTTGVPIDGGILALLIASGAFGYNRMRKANTNHIKPQST